MHCMPTCSGLQCSPNIRKNSTATSCFQRSELQRGPSCTPVLQNLMLLRSELQHDRRRPKHDTGERPWHPRAKKLQRTGQRLERFTAPENDHSQRQRACGSQIRRKWEGWSETLEEGEVGRVCGLQQTGRRPATTGIGGVDGGQSRWGSATVAHRIQPRVCGSVTAADGSGAGGHGHHCLTWCVAGRHGLGGCRRGKEVPSAPKCLARHRVGGWG